MNEWQIVKFAVYAGTLALLTAVQHMAFRTPQWQRREYARRAMGIGTVLLIALLYVLEGLADMTTWLLFAGLFVIAGVVKGIGVWLDNNRRTALLMRAGLHERQTSED